MATATTIQPAEQVGKDEIDVIFTFTLDEYFDAGKAISMIRDRFGEMSNTDAILKALELASTMPPPKPQEGPK